MPALALVCAVGASQNAQALTSNCSDENGDCTVDNLPDNVDCECVGGIGFGGTGGDDWDNLNQAELDAVCLEQLSDCAPFGGTTFGGSTTFGGDSSVGPPPGTTFGSDVTTDPTVGTISVGTDGTDGTGDTTGSGDGTSIGTDDSTTGGFTLTGGSTGDDTSGGPETDDSASMSASMSGASMSGDTNPDPTNGDDSSGGDESSGENTDETGCGCRSTEQSPAYAALGLLGLIFLRRRRR